MLGELETGRLARRALASALGALSLLAALGLPDTHAQTIPAGFQEYFVTGFEQHVWNMMNNVAVSEGATSYDNSPRFANGMNSAVAVAVSQDGQRVYYDHWEDGFDPGIDVTSATFGPGFQATSLALGDSDLSNGKACDYTTDSRVSPCSGVPSHDDSLYVGMVLSFNSDQGLVGLPLASLVSVIPTIATATTTTPHNFTTGDLVTITGAVAAPNRYNGTFGITVTGATTFTYPMGGISSSPAGGTIQARPAVRQPTGVGNCTAPNPVPADDRFCTVPVNPRGGAIRFDGGDRIVSAGGPLTMAHHEDPISPFITGTLEVLPKQAVANAVSYSIPVGVDIYAGPASTTAPFKYVRLDLIAFTDNTQVTITSPGVGSVSFTLNKGQSYSSQGAIDLVANPGIAIAVNAGTKITTTGPLNGMIFAGGDGNFASRAYALLPDILHSTDYIITAPGDDPAILGPQPLNLYMLNPDPINTLNLTLVDSVGTSMTTVGPGQSKDYFTATGRNVPANSTVRLTSNRAFWGISAYGHQSSANDWGHAWLAKKFLSASYEVPYGPGVDNPKNFSRPIVGGTRTLVSLTSSGATATATTATPHNFQTGETVTIAGATSGAPNNYNGAFAVSVTSPTSFTYTMAGAPGSSPAGGVITATNGTVTLNSAPSVATATTTNAHGMLVGELFRIIGAANAAYNGTFRVASVPTATTFSYAIVGNPGPEADPNIRLLRLFDRGPLFVSAVEDNTVVYLDLDNDGVNNYVDTDGDDCPDDGAASLVATNCEAPPVVAACPALTVDRCAYLVNSLQSLRVFDSKDYDNAGTRVIASVPVAVAWGEDTDRATGSDPILDSGYSVYPQLFLDPVFTLDKTVAASTVPLAGGNAVYTLTARSYNFGPLTSVQISDLLPAGATGYVPGSTLITYPNLSQGTNDPTISVVSGRTQLSWALSPDSMPPGTTITVRYTASYPPAPGGTPRTLTNDAQAMATLGGSVFNPQATANVVQTNLSLTKAVDVTSPRAGDILTFTLTVANPAGGINETNAVITDAIPVNTMFVPGSITNAGPFTGAYNGGQNAAVWTAASFNAGTGPLALTFQVQVNPGTPAGTVINNKGEYRSNETPSFDSNPVQPVVIGPRLSSSKSGPVRGVSLTSLSLSTPTTAVSSLTSAGTTASATTAAPHGFLTGNVVSITGATSGAPNTYDGTFGITVTGATSFTYTLSGAAGSSPAGGTITAGRNLATGSSGTPHGFSTGDRIEIAGADQAAYNGIFPVSVTGATSFTYSMTASPGTAGSGALSATRTVAVALLTSLGTTATVTTAGIHGLATDDFAAISGANQSQYNGTFRVAVTSPTTFTYTVAGTPTSPATGTIAVTPSPIVRPGQVVTFDVRTRNIGNAGATNVSIVDSIPANTTYVAGSLSFSRNGGPFTVLTDAADSDEGTNLGTSLQLLVASLGPGEDLDLRFRVQVNTGAAAGQFVANQASVSSLEVNPAATNVVSLGIVAASVTGHVFLDLNGNGVLDPGEPPIANVDVVVTDVNGATSSVTTNANGDYGASVPPGATTLNVSESDPDFPAGAVLTTANDPQLVVAVAGFSVPSTSVGYVPASLAITKTSSPPGHLAVPGETITYTVSLTNNSSMTQTGVSISDPVPAGTTFVSARVAPAIRVSEYFIGTGAPDLLCGGAAFTGTTCSLTLNKNLQPNYFVIVQGGDGRDDDTSRDPDQNYVSLTADPFATGQLAASGAASQIVLTRGAASNGGSAWVGVVTVVECAGDCATNGFSLIDVRRLAHAGGSPPVLGPVPVAVPGGWSDLSRVQLVGGFNGAGCDTTEANNTNNPVCWTRLVPSGTGAGSSITWTRQWVPANGASNPGGAATSTVMSIQWGSAWTVNRQNVTGTAGAAGANVVGAYDVSAAFAAVARSRTWVFGTGTTNDNGVGNGSEGALITLGNGVTANATETTVAVGLQNALNATSTPPGKDFEVWALAHPQLTVDHRFKADGDAASTAVAVPVNSATSNRMGLVYNGMSGTGDEYSRPMLSARYTSNTSIELRRRRDTSDSFAAWVQGIDFSAISTPAPHAPPNPVQAGDGYTLAPGESITLTYLVTVDANVTDGQLITNTATGSTTALGPVMASIVDTVFRPGLAVQYDNAAFAVPNSTLLFDHSVTNTGTQPDSCNLTLANEKGWKLELIDPASGIVIATDTNGDGVWDGGVTINTGTLAPGATARYRVRVTVPPGAMLGDQATTRLLATSAASLRGTPLLGYAQDEITIRNAPDLGTVTVLPDNSGVVTPGGSIVYAHHVVNNTGLTDTFDLNANSTQAAACGVPPCWNPVLYADTNGDGVYTPGVDLQIANTQQLGPGQSQLIFTVVNAPGTATPDQVDVTHLTATSRNDSTKFGGATDTTTVRAATSHDLSGGGTRLVNPSTTGVYPGTLQNLGSASDTFNFSLSQSSLFDTASPNPNQTLDNLLHPIELWIDTDADGIPDTFVARDDNGNGTWDTIAPAYATCPAMPLPVLSPPCVPVGPGPSMALAYELRRPVDPAQRIPREYVTLTTQSNAAKQTDSITATNLLAAVTRVTLRGLRVDPRGVIEFATGSQRGTAAFNLYETDDPKGESGLRPVNRKPVISPLPNSISPILYRVETRATTKAFLVIEEVELRGTKRRLGPFAVGDEALARALSRIEARLDDAGVPTGPVRVASGRALKRFGRAMPTLDARSAIERDAWKRAPRRKSYAEGVKLVVEGRGVAQVSFAALQEAGLRIKGRLKLSNQGREVPSWSAMDRSGGALLVWNAEPLSTDYTGSNVYVVTSDGKAEPLLVDLTRSGDAPRAGATRIEKSAIYLASAPLGSDPWLWDLVFASPGSWPNGWDADAGEFELPNLLPRARGKLGVRLRLYGYTDDEHTLEARINGVAVGKQVSRGISPFLLVGSVPAEALRPSGNQLSLSYSAVSRETSRPDPAGLVYLDYLEIDAPLAAATAAVPLLEIDSYQPDLPDLGGTEYLIVTHPSFHDQAEAIAAQKQGAGLKTAVVDVDVAFDHYSAAIPEANAVKALIRDAARKSKKLRFVLLIGDDTFDTHDYLGLGSTSYVPSLSGWDGQFGRVPSENRYADVDGDAKPDLAIGRLPVQTGAQADALVRKLRDQADVLKQSLGRHLFVTDNSNSLDAPFREEAASVAAGLPQGSAAYIADMETGVERARQTLKAAWQSGMLMTHYFGHGGIDIWADEQILDVETLEELGATRQTLLFAWACESQFYLNLWGPAINEALVLVPDGGAAASFGPAGISTPAAQRSLYEAVYRRLFAPGSDLTLGEVLRDAKREALDVDPLWSPTVIEGFNLLGDPALRIPQAPKVKGKKPKKP